VAGGETVEASFNVACAELTIAFTRYLGNNAEVYAMAPTGLFQTNLTNHPTVDGGPAWSPDGSRIAFQGHRGGGAQHPGEGTGDVWVMNADGSNPTNLTNNQGEFQLRPTWSPNGSQIAFMSRWAVQPDGEVLYGDKIYVMNADGSDLRLIADTNAGFPSWSPVSDQILFTRGGNVWIMNSDGTAQHIVLRTADNEVVVTWSPDGTEIAAGGGASGGFSDIWIMRPDGSDRRRLLDSSENKRIGGWSPDGSQFVLDIERDGNVDVYVLDLSTGELTRLTTDPEADVAPSWKP
jgi:Tol biopolymer transport system component